MQIHFIFLAFKNWLSFTNLPFCNVKHFRFKMMIAFWGNLRQRQGNNLIHDVPGTMFLQINSTINLVKNQFGYALFL